MKSDSDILREVRQGINDNLLVTQWWRANEIRDNYGLYEGNGQWLPADYSRQIANNMPVRTINRIQPIIDAVGGFQIQNRSEVKVVPRITSDQEAGFSDLGNDGIKWIQDVSNYNMVKSLAFTDMLISGLGFIEYKIGYGDGKTYDSSSSDSGMPWCERVFPYFMLWDVTTRDKNLEGANWICRAKIVDRQQLEQLTKGLDSEDMSAVDAEFGASVDARFLDFFNTVLTVKSLGVVYHYQWREKKKFYKIRNPLIDFEGDPDDVVTQQVMELANTLQDLYTFNPISDQFLVIPSSDYKEVQELFDMIGYYQLEKAEIRKWVYYRADIVGNYVLNKTENFSQSGFSIQAISGKYDEIRQCYYGLVRSMKEPQRLLNKAVSDYEGFLLTIPKGGVYLESDSVPSLEGFRDTYTKAAQITVVSPGSITNGKIMPKTAPPIPDGLLNMIEYASSAMMAVIGITPDFMGQVDSKLMTAQLNSQLVRQGMMVLAPYFDSITMFTKQNGVLFLEMLRVLLDNEEGRLIGHITPEGNKANVAMFKENLAPQYDVVVEEVPMTPDERQRTFEKLIELAQLLANKPNPVDIAPIAIEYAPLKENEIAAIKTLMEPPPPPPPDPLQVALLESEVGLKQSLAQKQSAEAMKYNIEALLKEKELNYKDQELSSDIIKQLRSAEYDKARAMKEIQSMHIDRAELSKLKKETNQSI